MPAPASDAPQPKAGAKVRPALSDEEARALSLEDLAQRGYPMRPDPAQAPDAYAAWLKAVSTPATMVSARQVENSSISHGRRKNSAAGYETSSNWSGFELRGSNNTYVLTYGEWYVPTVYYETDTPTYSAYWIGLDGDGTSDLVQDGTEQDITDIYIFGIHFDFTNYYAWTEFLPQQPYEQVISNFSVSPGDLILTECWVGNPGYAPYLGGADGIFWIENISRREYTTIYTARGSTYVGGSEAEWIMERPTVGGSLPDLADYSYAYMYDAWAYQTNNTWMNYDGANYEQIAMYNGSDLLSYVYPITNTEMLFWWFNWH